MKWLDRLFGGSKDMAALPPGTKAPDFSLPAVFQGEDGGEFSLQAALKRGPVLVAFLQGFRVRRANTRSPISNEFTKRMAIKKITILGISQNNQRDTAAFLKEYGVTFPTLLDDPS